MAPTGSGPRLPVIDRYQITRGLGRGAMGSVYLAVDPKIGREVAVKVLQKEFAQDAKHRQRFEREAKAIAALKHPNIVEIFDYGGSPDEHLFLVMEYIKGPHTGALCREHGPLPETVLASLGIELASALHRAHEGGIIHRDLKPENVFLDEGRVVLADFGIAKAIAEDNPFGAEAASAYTDVIGTPGFMAPEQLEQKRLDARTDIFSFGALLYYLASQKLPFTADSPYALLKVFQETRPIPLEDRRPELSEQVSRLVQDCLEVAPLARPPNMAEVRKRLRDVLDLSGAREPREILAEYEAGPLSYRAIDRSRVVQHLLGRLKIAVRDKDGVTADEIRARLAVLDPNNREALSISGVRQLWREADQVLTPEMIAGRRSRSPWILGALVVTSLMVGASAYIAKYGLPKLGRLIATTGDTATKTEEVTLLEVKATDRTHVFLNGRALGTTPNFAPAAVPSGEGKLELVHEKKGRLHRTVGLVPGQRISVMVDWRLKKVTVRTTKR